MLWVNGNGHLIYSNDQPIDDASVCLAGLLAGWLAGWLAMHIQYVVPNSFAFYLSNTPKNAHIWSSIM